MFLARDTIVESRTHQSEEGKANKRQTKIRTQAAFLQALKIKKRETSLCSFGLGTSKDSKGQKRGGERETS